VHFTYLHGRGEPELLRSARRGRPVWLMITARADEGPRSSQNVNVAVTANCPKARKESVGRLPTIVPCFHLGYTFSMGSPGSLCAGWSRSKFTNTIQPSCQAIGGEPQLKPSPLGQRLTTSLRFMASLRARWIARRNWFTSRVRAESR